jgi:hypothetical protein
MSVNELVKNEKKQVSSIVIVKPNTHPNEIPHLKAVSTGNSIIITSLANRDEFINNREKWIKMISDNKEEFEASQLVTTLESLCTSLEKTDKKPDPILKTTTISGIDKVLGITLAHDYFADISTGELDLIPAPFTYKGTLAGTEYLYCESVVVWRAYIDNSETAVKNEKKKKGANANMERLTKMLQGTKIN